MVIRESCSHISNYSTYRILITIFLSATRYLLNMLHPRIRCMVRSSTSNLLRRRIHSRCIRTCRPKRLLRTMLRFIRLSRCLSNQVMLSTQGRRLMLHVLIVRLCRMMAEYSPRETQILYVQSQLSYLLQSQCLLLILQSRLGVDQLADAVGRNVFIDTPTPSPDSTKATGGAPADVPGSPIHRGRRSVSRLSSDSESADRRVRPRAQDELRKDYRRLLETADEFRARFPGRTYIAPESSQLHSFTLRQHRKRLVGTDQLGRRYLNATDWETFPNNGTKEEQREWMERHGFYVCCVECKALRRDCSHTYPCSDCRSNGRQRRIAHPGHDHGICRYGMTCEEPHDEYFAFLDFCLKIPKNTINFWEFPSKLFRQIEHGCQDRNGVPCHVRQMPMRGIALPYSADNPYGYTGRPPRWICEQFRPQAD